MISIIKICLGFSAHRISFKFHPKIGRKQSQVWLLDVLFIYQYVTEETVHCYLKFMKLWFYEVR